MLCVVDVLLSGSLPEFMGRRFRFIGLGGLKEDQGQLEYLT